MYTRSASRNATQNSCKKKSMMTKLPQSAELGKPSKISDSVL